MARIYDRYLRQRLSRRRVLKTVGGTAIGAGAVALVGCGDGGGGSGTSNGPTPNPNETPTVGGILRVQQTFPFPSLSPFGLTALASSLVFGFTAYDHLWYVPIDTGETVPMLASAVEVPDPEGLEVICPIQQAFYHDKPPVSGRQVVASDVVESWIKFRDDPFGLGRAWLREIMESVKAPDEQTVVIKQKRPFAWMFGVTAAGSPASSSVLPAETLDLGDLLAGDVIGSGRLFLESHRNGENLKFRAFPRWRIPGEPFLGGLDYILITEPTAAQAQFRAGNLDQITFNNKLEADQMQGELGDRITITSELTRSYHVLMLKMTPPWDDERVRHAINLALDRQELIQLVELDPAGGEPCGIVPPAQSLYALDPGDADMQEYFRHNTEEARALLEEASFPFDREFALKYPSNEEIAKRAQVIKDQLGRAGVKVRLEDQDLLTVWLPRTLNQGEFDMTLFTQLPYEDPYLPLGFYTNQAPIGPQDDPRGRNNMGFFDDEVIAAADAAARELDLDARVEKVREAQRLIIRKWGPMLNLYSSVDFSARWNWYKGWTTGQGSYSLFNGRAWIDTALRGS
ncbi:MAG: ABC transporter substrate-binding protein [Chloroflexi bacterium]|nr:ABC transporter substrate-binding protein [Chloroflexota bacterium]